MASFDQAFSEDVIFLKPYFNNYSHLIIDLSY